MRGTRRHWGWLRRSAGLWTEDSLGEGGLTQLSEDRGLMSSVQFESMRVKHLSHTQPPKTEKTFETVSLNISTLPCVPLGVGGGLSLAMELTVSLGFSSHGVTLLSERSS